MRTKYKYRMLIDDQLKIGTANELGEFIGLTGQDITDLYRYVNMGTKVKKRNERKVKLIDRIDAFIYKITDDKGQVYEFRTLKEAEKKMGYCNSALARKLSRGKGLNGYKIELVEQFYPEEKIQ